MRTSELFVVQIKIFENCGVFALGFCLCFLNILFAKKLCHKKGMFF